MKRFLSIILCAVLILSALVGCSGEATDNVRIVGVMNSPYALLSHMIEKSEGNNNYISSPVNLPSRIRTMAMSDECDIAVVPFDTACNLYKSANPKIKVLAGISVGGFEIVSTEAISDISELKGKSVYLTEHDTLMADIFEFLTKNYGLTLHEDITFNYTDDFYTLKEAFKAKEANVALVTSAEATVLKSEVSGLNTYSLTDELAKKFKKPSIITYCVIGTNDFIDDNPEIIETLLKDIENSVSNSKNQEETIKLGKKHGILTDDMYDKEFLSTLKADFISGESMQKKITAYFKMIEKFRPSLVRKIINKDDFFYIPKTEK